MDPQLMSEEIAIEPADTATNTLQAIATSFTMDQPMTNREMDPNGAPLLTDSHKTSQSSPDNSDEGAEYFREPYIEGDDKEPFFRLTYNGDDDPEMYFGEAYTHGNEQVAFQSVENWLNGVQFPVAPSRSNEIVHTTIDHPISLLNEPFNGRDEPHAPSDCPLGELLRLITPDGCVGCGGQH